MSARRTTGPCAFGVALKDREQVRLHICDVDKLFVEYVIALFAIPPKPVQLSRSPGLFHHQPHTACRATGAVGSPALEHKNLTLPNRNILGRTLIRYNPQHHIPFKLVEKLIGLVNVEVQPLVGAAHYHHDKGGIGKNLLIAHGRLENFPMIVDPLLKGKGLYHDFSPIIAKHLSSTAMGVGRAPTSSVVRQGRLVLKYSP